MRDDTWKRFQRYLEDIRDLRRHRHAPMFVAPWFVRLASAKIWDDIMATHGAPIEDRLLGVVLGVLGTSADVMVLDRAPLEQEEWEMRVIMRDRVTINVPFEDVTVGDLFQWAFANDERRARIEPFNIDGIREAYADEALAVALRVVEYFRTANPKEFELVTKI